MANNVMFQPHKSSLGMNANLAMLIAYLGSGVLALIPIVKYVAFAVPIVLFFLEKSSPYVRFHAAQSTVLSVVSWVFTLIMSLISAIAQSSLGGLLVGGALALIFGIINFVIFVLEIICLIKSWKYEAYKLPVTGNLAESICARFPL